MVDLGAVLFCGLSFGVGAVLGALLTDEAWRYRKAARELAHKEKMALIEQRTKMLEDR